MEIVAERLAVPPLVRVIQAILLAAVVERVGAAWAEALGAAAAGAVAVLAGMVEMQLLFCLPPLLREAVLEEVLLQTAPDRPETR